VHYVLRLDFVQAAELPVAKQLAHRPGEPAQDVELVNGLIDQRATPFRLPASLDGPRIISGRAVPLDVAVALQQLAQAPCGECLREELAGVVEAMLAHNAKHDLPLTRHFDHPAGGFETGRDGLLYL